MKYSFFKAILAAAFCALFALPVSANEPVERTNTNTLWFESWGALSNATLKITTPDGTHKDVFAQSGTPVFNLRDVAPPPDGVYSYELTAATDEKITIKNPINNGRGKDAKKERNKPLQLTGFFIVQGGAITVKKDITEDSED